MAGRLSNKVVVVVGAGSIGEGVGNGSASAVAFAREGAKVVCADRSLNAAQRTVGMIEASGGAATAFCADVLRSDQVKSLMQHAAEQFGRIDVLHHNVGIEEFGELTELTEESWDRVHAINLKGAMLTNREVVPYMIRQGGGSIINVSSLASLRWSPMQFLSYSTSKAALNHMTRVVARQYAKHQVRCNALVLGMIDTPHADALFKNEEEAQRGREMRNAACPMGRQGTPWDVANTAVFLASDESSYVTGLEFLLDGGLSL
jgi:NAD(P)-dependent dehydrogenase (short-subunit alcohol dehydrogenase family)